MKTLFKMTLIFILFLVCSPNLFGQSPEFQVNTYTAGDQEWLSIAGLSNGGFVVTWDSFGQDGSGYGVYGQIIDSSGNKVGGEFRVNTYTNNSQWLSCVAALPAGGFVVVWGVWSQDGSDKGIYGQRFDSSGNKVGSEFQVNTSTEGSQDYASVAVLTDGTFVVVWDNYISPSMRYIYGQRFDSSGNKVENQFQIGDIANGDLFRNRVKALSDGGFVITWMKFLSSNSMGLFGQKYDSSGNKVGSQIQINSTPFSFLEMFDPVAALVGGGFVVTWPGDPTGIYGQRYDNSGNRIGDSFEILSNQQGIPASAGLLMEDL